MLNQILTVALATFVSTAAFADYELNCIDLKAKTPGTSIVTVLAAETPSHRITSELIETRSATDSESLPSFLVAQYKADAREIYILLDDSSPAGNLLAELDLKAIGKKKGDSALWRYQGTYKRFDVGRQLNVKVECAVTQ